MDALPGLGAAVGEDTLGLTRGESRRQRDDRKVLAATDRKARCR